MREAEAEASVTMVSISGSVKIAVGGAALLAVLAQGLAWTVGRSVPMPPADLSHFHSIAPSLDAPVPIYDVSMQVKAVAASRHAPIAEVRHLLDGYTVRCRTTDSAAACVDVPALNRRLDADWPVR